MTEEHGYFEACVSCPASLICLTHNRLRFFWDGLIIVPKGHHGARYNLDLEADLEHCPLAHHPSFLDDPPA